MDPRTPRSQLPLVLPRPSATVRFGLSPHSPHTVSLTALASIRDHAATRKLRLCMHVAETGEELALLRHEPSSIDRLYQSAGWDPAWAPRARTSVDYLAAHDLLDNRFLAVHAVHVNRHDIALLQRSGAAVAHCPRSNHRLRTGTMPLKAMLDAGIPVGLGTDSLASTESVNLWDEMRFAYQVHRRHGITAGRIMTMAGLGGARALGLDKETGSLERGKKADIIAVPLPPRSGGDLLSDLLMHTKSCTMTLVNGRLLHATAAVTFGAPGAMQTAPART